MSASEHAASLPDAELQRLLAATVRAYAQRAADDPELPPFGEDDEVTPTEVALTVTRMLDAAELELFELAAWRTWGRP